MAEYAGLDLGATRIRAAVATADGTVLGEDRRSTPRTGSGRDVVAALVASLESACADAGVQPDSLRAVGVGTIGPLDAIRGAVVGPANLPHAVIPLREPLESAVGSGRVVLHNDAVAGVIAERTFGNAGENVVYLTISSGIGAGVCVDGEVLRGRDGNAGEVGHFTVDPGGAMTCGCGSPGHWEAYCSGENIPRYARYLHDHEGHATALDLDDLTAEGVFAAVDDDLAGRVIERVADWNVIGIGNVVDAFAPETIVVGGSVALENPGKVLDPVRARLDDHTVGPAPDIHTTDLGDLVVVRGALASVLPR